MTEREDLLSDLLTTPTEAVENTMQTVHSARIHNQPDILTEDDEQALLRAANAVGPVTLSTEPAMEMQSDEGLVQDIGGFVRRYPIPTALAVAGLAYAIARRKRH
jgi:hypothetical protein